MSESHITQQLNTEINKLKEQDYTSYQKFYNETSNYLYQVIWNGTREKNAADELLNELYTNIYASIGTELTDNSQFYVWAEEKAQTLTNTYMTTHNIVGGQGAGEKDRRIKDAAVMAAANAGMYATDGISEAIGSGIADNMAIDAGRMGVDSVAGGAGQVGYGSAAGGAGQMGMRSVEGGAGQTGYGSTGAGMEQYGVNQPVDGASTGRTSGSETGPSAGATSRPTSGVGKGVAKVGSSIAVKIGVALVVVSAVIGVVVGAIAIRNTDRDENKMENTTEVAADDDSIVQENSTEDSSEAVIESADTVERYAAYYDVVKTYMQDYPYQPVIQDENVGFLFAKLVDFNYENKEQLIIAYSEAAADAWYNITYTVKIFDYADGQATEVATFNTSKIGFSEEEGSIALWTTEAPSNWNEKNFPESYKVIKTMYNYEDGSFVAKHEYVEEVIIKDDYTFEVESETGYVDNEVRPVEEVRELISSIDERCDNYEFNYIIRSNAKPLLTKHLTMDMLAEVSGDMDFVNAVSNVVASVENDGPNYTYTYSANKYNESYALLQYSTKGAPDTSADLMTVRNYYFSTGMEMREDADICYTFYHDVLLVTGYKDYTTKTYYWADEEAYLNKQIYPMYDDSNIVSVDEYNSNADALINR